MPEWKGVYFPLLARHPLLLCSPWLQPGSNLEARWAFRHPEAHARLAEALLAGHHLLARAPAAAASYDQRKRLLRWLRNYQLQQGGRDAAGLALAALQEGAGEAGEAYDGLVAPPGRATTSGGQAAAGVEAERARRAGAIRFAQWRQVGGAGTGGREPRAAGGGRHCVLGGPHRSL